ncbi:MAG: thiamine pyrophosphate-binding protein, partial [Pseudomonadota bacterium]|nr:thiamine pyrophosphate-binding protein [Pseudomonadota bacterium]
MTGSAEEILVGDMVAEFLQQIGVTTTFGVISIHNIPMLDAIGRRNAIRFVMARGEAGGGHMADAYARVSGELGVLFTSTGPGAANACGAIVEARFAGAPMLHLTGQTATPNMDLGQGAVHDVADQLGMLRSVSKNAYRVRSAETAFGTLVKAATEAMRPPMGPISVEIPIDIQRTKIPRPAELATLSLPTPIADPGAEGTLDEIAKRLTVAKRPLLWVGNGAKFAGAAVARLVDLGIPVITSWNGRGVLPEDHPMSLGSLATTPDVSEFLKTIDLLVVAGCRLRGHETADMSMPLP